MSRHINSDDKFEDLLNDAKENRNLLLIKWSTSWCGPCKVIAPVFEKYAQDNKLDNLIFVSVDPQKVKDNAEEFNVRGIPAFHLVKVNSDNSLNVLYHFTGANQEKLNNVVADVCAKKFK